LGGFHVAVSRRSSPKESAERRLPHEALMTGYEQSPDYGDPPPGRGSAVAVIVALVVIGLLLV